MQLSQEWQLACVVSFASCIKPEAEEGKHTSHIPLEFKCPWSQHGQLKASTVETPYSFRDYCRDVNLWMTMQPTSATEAQMLAALMLNITGTARYKAEELEPAQRVHGDLVGTQQLGPVPLMLHKINESIAPTRDE